MGRLGLRAAIVGALLVWMGIAWQQIVIGERRGARQRALTLPPEIQWCEEDGDCGIANQIACCPCEFGGVQGAVNRARRPDLKAFLRRACTEGVPCVEVASCRDDLKPACRRHRCRIVTGSR